MKKNDIYHSKTIEDIIDEDNLHKQIETKMRIACKLDDQRRKLGWSVEDMAKAFGKSQNLMRGWMSGTHNYTIDTIVLIEEVMGINLINRKKL